MGEINDLSKQFDAEVRSAFHRMMKKQTDKTIHDLLKQCEIHRSYSEAEAAEYIKELTDGPEEYLMEEDATHLIRVTRNEMIESVKNRTHN